MRRAVYLDGGKAEQTGILMDAMTVEWTVASLEVLKVDKTAAYLDGTTVVGSVASLAILTVVHSVGM